MRRFQMNFIFPYALPLPSLASNRANTPLGLHIYPMVCVCIFWDGVGPSVNCVWPLVSGGLTAYTHTQECFPSGVHTAYSMVGWLISLWKASLIWGANFPSSQKEMSCEKGKHTIVLHTAFDLSTAGSESALRTATLQVFALPLQETPPPFANKKTLQ